MNNKNTTNAILDSLDKVKKAAPSEDFLVQMENLADRYTLGLGKFSIASIFGIAATFLFLILANYTVLKTLNSTVVTKKQNESYNTYHLIPTKNIFDE